MDYLTAELMSLQMYHCNKSGDKASVIELLETPVATALQRMSSALGMGLPPPTLVSKDLFHRLSNRIEEVLSKAGRARIGKPLLDPNQSWDPKHWNDLEKRHAELDQEYDLRREMLLTRLDCTVQAFNWSERMKPKQSHILETYRSKLAVLERLVKGGPSTDIVALLAARDLLLAIEKASSAAVLKNTKSKIQRHIMGSVPDRGEQPPDPPILARSLTLQFNAFQVDVPGNMPLLHRKCRPGRSNEQQAVAHVVVVAAAIRGEDEDITAEEATSNFNRIAIKIHSSTINRAAMNIIGAGDSVSKVVGPSGGAVQVTTVQPVDPITIITIMHLIRVNMEDVVKTTEEVGISQPIIHIHYAYPCNVIFNKRQGIRFRR